MAPAFHVRFNRISLFHTSFIQNLLKYNCRKHSGTVLFLVLLFGLFSSDLPRVPIHCKCRKYVNDTQIYYHVLPSKLDDALGLVECDAQAVADWGLNNGLELNTKKTQVIILGSSHYTSSIDLTRLRKICVKNTSLLYTTQGKSWG